MYLKNVYIRFYKSFNFDYLRKFNPRTTDRFPWENLDRMWYPYVRIPIDEKITTVVGENESGKTHLLTAIEKGIRGQGIEREDFCRYSQFFARIKRMAFSILSAGITEMSVISYTTFVGGFCRVSSLRSRIVTSKRAWPV